MASILEIGNYIQQGFKDGEERGTRNRLASLASQAYGATGPQRNALIGQMVATDPNAGMAMGDKLQSNDDAQAKRAAGAARYMLEALRTKDMNRINGSFRTVRPYFQSLAPDRPLPEVLDESNMQGMEPMLHQILAAGAANGPVDDGTPSDIRSLQMLQANPELAKLDRERRQAGGMVPKLVQTANGYSWGVPGQALAPAYEGAPGAAAQPAAAPASQPAPVQQQVESVVQAANWMAQNGVPDEKITEWIQQQPGFGSQPAPAAAETFAQPQGQRAMPYVAPTAINADRRAEDANRRAEEANRIALQRYQDAQRGTAPAGQRFRPDGTLEDIPGARNPSGAVPTEGERGAAGFLQRMQAAEAEVSRLAQAGYRPNLRDSYTAGEGALVNWMASDTGQVNRQQQEDWVRAKLRKESGAAIPNDEMDREIKTYFPQIGDSEAVIASKARSRQTALRQMELVAGRAEGGANAPLRSAAPSASAAPRARNPQTGEMLELRNGQWVPAR